MRTTILGAGSIAFGMAAFLRREGHEVTMWSRSGQRTAALSAGTPLTATGVFTGEFAVQVAADIGAAIGPADCIILAVPGYGHRAVIEAAVPFLRTGQSFIISSHCSFSALYLSRLLAARGVHIVIAALGTTLLSGRRSGDANVNITNLRQRLDVATLPASLADEGLRICRALFGDRLQPRSDLLAIALSNLNPQNHMAMALCNLTRIENGEAWGNYAGITGAVGRLIEQLDAERLRIATRLGASVRSVQDHFHLSFDVPRGTIAEMAAKIHARGNAPLGPTSLETRYVLEDVPFGLVTSEALGRIASIPTPLHSAGIDLFSAMYDIDFRAQNDLLPVLALEGLSAEALAASAVTGSPPRPQPSSQATVSPPFCIEVTMGLKHTAAQLAVIGCIVAASLPQARAQAVDSIVTKLRATGTLTMGYRETIAPTSFLGADGKPAGYAVDFCARILELVQAEMGIPAIKVTALPVTLQTRQALVANGTVDLECGGTVNTFSRSRQVDFTPVTYVASNQLLALKSSGISTLQDLNGKIVAVAGSGSSEPELQRIVTKENLKLRVLNVDDHAAGLIAVETRRADAYFSDNSSFYGLMKQSRHPEALAIVGPEIGYQPQAFMIPKNNPAFLWLVSHAMAKMFASGEAETIYMKWFGPLGGTVGPSLRGAWATFTYPE